MTTRWTWLIWLCILAASPALGATFDQATPKGAAKSFYTALAAGDLEAARSAAVVSDENQAALKTLVAYAGAFTRLCDAIEAKFGKDAAAQFPSPAKRVALMDTAAEKIDGDSASLSPADGSEALLLTRTGGQWKVDIFATPSFHDPGAMVRQLTGITAAASATAEDTAAGKYKSLDDLKKALAERLQQYVSTGPATAPVGAPVTSPAAGDKP